MSDYPIVPAPQPGRETLGTVLVVDDEPNVLSVVRRVFRQAPFRLLTAGSGAEALELLESTSLDLILSDARMPGMDGAELLGIVRSRYPGVDRAMLSGQVERDVVLRSVISGVARLFYTKPWEGKILEERIVGLLRTRGMLRQAGLLKVVSEIDGLPPVALVYDQFMAAVAAGRPMAEIAALMEKDVALAVKIMQIANSAFHGQRGVATVGRAVSILGLEAAREMLLMVSLEHGSDWSASQERELKRIVLHSILANRLTGEAYRLHVGRALDDSPSCGLLHDVGKIVLLRHLPERYQAASELAAREGRGFGAAERALGFAESDHARLGGLLLDRWNFPQLLIETALFHGEPARASEPYVPVIEAVRCADAIAEIAVGNAARAIEADRLGYLGKAETERLVAEAGTMAKELEGL